MAVLCFSSLKGGVGKTSLSIHIARAFAERGCETLLVDLDPTAHASRFFKSDAVRASMEKSPLAKLFFSHIDENVDLDQEGLLERAYGVELPLVHQVSKGLALLPASAEFRHFLWGRGARLFKAFFPALINELNCAYDCVVIDTPPDFNVLTRNAIGASDLVIVPVDPSEMAINSLEEIVSSAAHIKGPDWAVVRVMVNKKASRINKLSQNRLGGSKLALHHQGSPDSKGIESFDDPNAFIEMLEEHEKVNGTHECGSDAAQDDPIYLLKSVIYRTELHNRLTYTGKTAFDMFETKALASQYTSAAKELERLLSIITHEEEAAEFPDGQPMQMPA